MSTFLTPAELEKLTGYVRQGAQIRRLREWGIEPFVSATNKIFVCRAIVEEVQRKHSGLEARSAQRRGPRPNLEVVT